MRRARFAVGAVVLVALAAVAGCGGDSGTPKPEDPAKALTDAGWGFFEEGALDSAEARFRDAIAVSAEFADANNGLGWTLAHRDDLENATAAFGAAIAAGLAGAEAFAGRAFVRAELSVAPSLALGDASTALARDPDFLFAHDATTDWRDLRLLRAQLFFIEGELDSAAADVDRLGGSPPEPGAPAYADSLLVEIERLGRDLTPPVL